MNDKLVFAKESIDPALAVGPLDNGAWKVLIVDDQEDVHSVTRLVLSDLAFEGRPIVCQSAYSAAEAREVLRESREIAVILLDVVMETVHAGLEVARYAREELHNRMVRIILRTGQPGEAPERNVVTELDINDYRSKTELTSDRLVTSVVTAIRSFRDLKAIDESRRGLHHLAMSVAHQIRNRTIAIAGFANLISRNDSLPDGVAEYLATIQEESARLEAMVGDVTRYASLRIGELRPVSIRELLEEAMERVEAASQRKTVAWKVLCPDQTVMVDPNLFVMAFQEILQNCVDFSPEGSEVRIEAVTARLSCTIHITDNGIGISDDDLPHVFDPFFTNKPNGSGMGLAVVKKIAMEHQWDIAIDSVLGKGTTVSTIIPRRELTGMK